MLRVILQPYLLHSTIGKSVKNVFKANGTKWKRNRAEHNIQQQTQHQRFQGYSRCKPE